MRSIRSASHGMIPVHKSGPSPLPSRPSIALLFVLPLLSVAVGCGTKAASVQERLPAPATASPRLGAPAFVALPTPESQLPKWRSVSASTAAIEVPVEKGLLIEFLSGNS